MVEEGERASVRRAGPRGQPRSGEDSRRCSNVRAARIPAGLPRRVGRAVQRPEARRESVSQAVVGMIVNTSEGGGVEGHAPDRTAAGSGPRAMRSNLRGLHPAGIKPGPPSLVLTTNERSMPSEEQRLQSKSHGRLARLGGQDRTGPRIQKPAYVFAGILPGARLRVLARETWGSVRRLFFGACPGVRSLNVRSGEAWADLWR